MTSLIEDPAWKDARLTATAGLSWLRAARDLNVAGQSALARADIIAILERELNENKAAFGVEDRKQTLMIIEELRAIAGRIQRTLTP